MVWNLTADEVVKHWDLIKYGAMQIKKPLDQERFYLSLLKEIFSGKAQVWFIADSERKIKNMTITKIISDMAGLNELLVYATYGYSATSGQEQREWFEALAKFAKTMKIYSILTYTTHEAVKRILQKAGWSSIHEVYQIKLEGED